MLKGILGGRVKIVPDSIIKKTKILFVHYHLYFRLKSTLYRHRDTSIVRIL